MKRIGTQAAFYGYITALRIEGRDLFAEFTYSRTRETWIVPDAELFAILAEHLASAAWQKQTRVQIWKSSGLRKSARIGLTLP